MSAAVRRYAVFLRGVNVGGVTLTSEKLLHIAHAAGFEHARTLLASGNLLVETDLDAGEVKSRIESALMEACGTAVPCFVRSAQRLEKLLQEDSSEPEGFHHYLLLASGDLWGALNEAYQALSHAEGEALFPHAEDGSADVHWIVQKENTLGDFGSKVLGRQYREKLTSRNIRTVKKAVAVLDDPDAFKG